MVLMLASEWLTCGFSSHSRIKASFLLQLNYLFKSHYIGAMTRILYKLFAAHCAAIPCVCT